MISHDDLLWLAGFLEGEGSFGAYLSGRDRQSETIVIQCTSTDLEAIERVANLFDRNVVSVGTKKDKRPANWKEQYGTRLHGMPAVQLMLQLYPLMGERRREQIHTALSKYNKFVAAVGRMDV